MGCASPKGPPAPKKDDSNLATSRNLLFEAVPWQICPASQRVGETRDGPGPSRDVAPVFFFFFPGAFFVDRKSYVPCWLAQTYFFAPGPISGAFLGESAPKKRRDGRSRWPDSKEKKK